MTHIEELESELYTNFYNQDIFIELKGDIDYFFKIERIKFLVNKLGLIISDNKENQVRICFDEVDDFEIKEKLINIKFNYEQSIKIYI